MSKYWGVLTRSSKIVRSNLYENCLTVGVDGAQRQFHYDVAAGAGVGGDGDLPAEQAGALAEKEENMTSTGTAPAPNAGAFFSSFLA